MKNIGVNIEYFNTNSNNGLYRVKSLKLFRYSLDGTVLSECITKNNVNVIQQFTP
jgi:hypothetical protein